MRIFVFTAVLLISATTAFCQDGCQKFRNGVFKMTADNLSVEITRNGGLQTEVVNGDKSTTVTFIVSWIDDCTYTLKATKETLAKWTDMPANGLLTVHIDKVSANSYTQTSTSNFSDMKITCEIFRVRKIE